jgi:hypothetical protein
MARARRRPILPHMTRNWEQYAYMASFAVAAAVVIAVMIW